MPPPSVSPPIALRCRGYPAVSVGGVAAPLKLKRGLALLVLQSEFARKVSRHQLADLLWPDAPAEVGRARLRRLCHEVNGVLGAGEKAVEVAPPPAMQWARKVSRPGPGGICLASSSRATM